MSNTGWCYLQSSLTDSDGTIYVAQANADDSVTLVPRVAPPPNEQLWRTAGQLWQNTADGRVISASNIGLVLTAPSSPGSGATVAAQVVPNSPPQVWAWKPDGLIQSQQSQEYLCPAGAPGTNPIITTTTDTGQSSIWQQIPAYPLDAVLAQPAVPFPLFTGDELTAYDYIETHLPDPPAGDLRAEYTNRAAPLAAWAGAVGVMGVEPPPANVSAASWAAVTAQLASELTDASSVQALFSNYDQYQTELMTVQESTLASLGIDAQMESGTNTNAVGAAVLQGTVYTLLSTIPEVGSVLANIVNTAISAALAAQILSPSPFQVAYSELWKSLAESFTAILDAVAGIATTILSDWGKLQATAQLIVTPGQLAWPETTADMVRASIPGFSLQVMQILLPAKYQIYVFQDQNSGFIDGPGSQCQWVETVGPDTYNHFWIADQTDVDAYPADAAMGDVFNNGASVQDFYFGNHGWGFPVCWYDGFNHANWNCVVVTITNQSTMLFTASITMEQGTVVGPAQQTLNPYNSVQLAAFVGGDAIQATITITDPNTHATAGTVSVYQPVVSWWEGQWPTATATAGQGYAISKPICCQAAVQGEVDLGYPGTVQVTIYPTQT